jgi:hypothetical protein
MFSHIFIHKSKLLPKQHLSLSILFGTYSLGYTYSNINSNDEKFFKLIMGTIAMAYFGKSSYHFMKFIKK